MVKTPPSNKGDAGLIPNGGARILHAVEHGHKFKSK